MRRLRVTLVAMATALLLTTAGQASASVPPPDGFTVDVYTNVAATEVDNYTCVAASAVTWSDEMENKTDVTGRKVMNFFNYGVPFQLLQLQQRPELRARSASVGERHL